MPNSIFKVTALRNELETRLYLHMDNRGYVDVANPNKSIHFPIGMLRVNDSPLYDSRGANRKLVGRARGAAHVQTGVDNAVWFHNVNLTFVDDRFKGSSLQATENHLAPGELAIVGGTGDLNWARGTIHKKLVQEFSNGEKIIELTIHALYAPLKKAT